LAPWLAGWFLTGAVDAVRRLMALP
jgi:hypothetical protein